MPSWEVIYRATAEFTDLMQAAARARDELKRLEAEARSEGAAETDAALKSAAAHQTDARAIDQQRQALEKLALAAKASNVQTAFGGRSSMDEHLRDLDTERGKRDLLNRSQWMGFSSPQQAEAFRQQVNQQQLLRNRAAQMGYTTPDQYLNYLDQERKRIDGQTAAIKARNLELQASTQAYTSHADSARQSHESAAQLGTTGTANIQGYAAAIQGLPDTVSTSAEFDSGEALRSVTIYNAVLDELPDRVTTTARLDTAPLEADVAKARGLTAAALPASRGASPAPSMAAALARAAAAGYDPGAPIGSRTAGWEGLTPDQSAAKMRAVREAQAALAAAQGAPASRPPSPAELSQGQMRGAVLLPSTSDTSAARAALSDLDKTSARPSVSVRGKQQALSDIAAIRAAISSLSRDIANPSVQISSTQALARLQGIRTALAAQQKTGDFRGLDLEPQGLGKAQGAFASLQQQAGRAFSDISFSSSSSAGHAAGGWRTFGATVRDVFRGIPADASDAAGYVTSVFQAVGSRIKGALSGISGGGLLDFFTKLANAAGQSAASVVGSLGPMSATLIALVQMLPALVAGFGAMSTVFAALPQGVASVAAGFIALKMALGPVMQALSAYRQVLAAQQFAQANPLQTSMQLAQQQNAVSNAYYAVSQAAYQARLSQLQNSHAVAGAQFALSQAVTSAAHQQIIDAHNVAEAQFAVREASYQSRMSRIQDAHAVGDAQFGLRQAEFQAAQSQIQDAHAVGEASFQLKQAQFSADMQRVQGAMAVAGAEHSLQDANFSVQQSQYQLTIAWQQARFQLMQLQLTVSGASLNMRGAQLGLLQAQQAYAQVMAQSTSTALDRAMAAYQIQQAEFNLKQVTLTSKENEQQLANVRKYGAGQVFGAVQAQHALVDAQFAQIQSSKQLIIAQKEAANAQVVAAHQVASAVYSLRQAIVQQHNDQLVGIHSVSDAQYAQWLAQQQQAHDFITSQHTQQDAAFSLAQAIYQQSQGRITSAHAIKDAEFALMIAGMQQSQGYISAAHDQKQAAFGLQMALDQQRLGLPAVASAQANLAYAMSQLGPAARQALLYLMPLAAWFMNNKAVADAFFKVLNPGLRGIMGLTGPLNSLLTQSAAAMGKIFLNLLTWFQNLAHSPFWDQLTRSTVKILTSLGDALVRVIDGLTKIAIAAQPFTTWLFAGIDHVAKRFQDWATAAERSGSGFRRWIEGVKPALDAIGSVLDAIVKGFQTLAGGPIGSPGAMASLRQFTDLMSTLAKSVLPAFFTILRALAQPALLNAMLLLVTALANLLGTVVGTPGFQVGFRIFVSLMSDLILILAKFLQLSGAAQVLGLLAGGLLAVAAAGAALKFTGILALITHLKEIQRWAIGAWGALGNLITRISGGKWTLPGSGGSSGPRNPQTVAAEGMQTAADTQLRASENMLTAAGRMQGAAAGEQRAGVEQDTAAAGEQVAAGELGTAAGAAGAATRLGALIPLVAGVVAALYGANTIKTKMGPGGGGGSLLVPSKSDLGVGGAWWQDLFGGKRSPGWLTGDLGGFLKGTSGPQAWQAMGQSFLRDVQDPVVHFFTKWIPSSFDSVKRWWSGLWQSNMEDFHKDIWQPLAGFLTAWIPNTFGSISRWWGGMWQANMQAFRQQIWQPLLGFFTAWIPSTFDSVKHWWSGLWQSSMEDFRKDIWQPLAGFLTNWVPNTFGSIGRWWNSLWQSGMSDFRKDIWQPLAGFFTSWVPGTFDSIGRSWNKLWQNGWTAFRQNILQPVGNWFSNTLPNAMEGAFRNAVRFVVNDIVNKAIHVINDVTRIVGISKIQDVKAPFAQGGAVMGHSVSGSGDHDSVNAMLTPGEFVIRKPARMALEATFGPEFLTSFINQADRKLFAAGGLVGQPTVPYYALGGQVGGGGSGTGGGAGATFGTGYRNPLRDIHPLSPSRIDMGVDYIGAGPVYAVGPGTIENTAPNGWPGLSFISERLSTGPYAGKLWYAAENIAPRVQTGQHVDTNTVIGHMYDSYPFSEFGWAASAQGLTEAAFHHQQNPAGDPGSRESAFGALAAEFLHSLGAPMGIGQGKIWGDTRGWASAGGGGGFLGLIENLGSSLSSAGKWLTGKLGIGAKELLALAGKGADAVFDAGWDHIVGPLASVVLGGPHSIPGAVGRAVLANARHGVDHLLTGWDQSNPGTGPTDGPGPATAGAAQAQAYARSQLGHYGWGPAQFPPLRDLWNLESGWNRLAQNPSSGAFGIPQALPYSKMPKAAWPLQDGGQASAGAQIDWGLRYIQSRYGSPSSADAHEHAYRWYGGGGPVGDAPLMLRMFTGGDTIDAIRQATSNLHIREAMGLGSWLESGWNPSASGDRGTSFGPFQIHLPAHPGVTRSQAQDPYWAARFMLPSYQRGVTAAGWGKLPYDAEQAAYLAERPAKTYYASQGTARVNAGWAATLKALSQWPVDPGHHPKHKPPPRPSVPPGPNADAAQRWEYWSRQLGSLATQQQTGLHALTGLNLHAAVRQGKLHEDQWATAYAQQVILGHQQQAAFGISSGTGAFARLWADVGTPQAMTAGRWSDFTGKLGELAAWEAGPNNGGRLPPSQDWAWEREGTGWPARDKKHPTWKSLGLPGAPGTIRPSPAELQKLASGPWSRDRSLLTQTVSAAARARTAWGELYSGLVHNGRPTPGPGVPPPLPPPGEPGIDLRKYILGGPGQPVYNLSGGGDTGQLARMFAFGGPVTALPQFAPPAAAAAMSAGGELPARQVSAAAQAVGGSHVGVQVNGGITVNNPVPERAGESIAHRVQRLAFLGGRGHF